MVSVTMLPQSRPLTRADLERAPDDGHRYELVDGALVVTPAPSFRHQSVVGRSTRLIDLTLKRARYAAARCPSYWVVDPDEPSITAWDLQGNEYVEAAHAVGDEQFDASTPYPVAIVPAQLVD